MDGRPVGVVNVESITEFWRGSPQITPILAYWPRGNDRAVPFIKEGTSMAQGSLDLQLTDPGYQFKF